MAETIRKLPRTLVAHELAHGFAYRQASGSAIKILNRGTHCLCVEPADYEPESDLHSTSATLAGPCCDFYLQYSAMPRSADELLQAPNLRHSASDLKALSDMPLARLEAAMPDARAAVKTMADFVGNHSGMLARIHDALLFGIGAGVIVDPVSLGITPLIDMGKLGLSESELAQVEALQETIN